MKLFLAILFPLCVGFFVSWWAAFKLLAAILIAFCVWVLWVSWAVYEEEQKMKDPLYRLRKQLNRHVKGEK